VIRVLAAALIAWGVAGGQFVSAKTVSKAQVIGAASAQAEKIKVTLLGTGAGPPVNLDRFGPGILVEAGSQKLLFDCGRAVTIRLTQAGVNLGEIRKLFLTHLHSDHVISIPDLFLTPWASGAAHQARFEVWGPAGTRDMMDHIQKAFAFDIHIRRDVDEKYSSEGISVSSHDIGEGKVFEQGGVVVTAFLVDHGPVKPALGYRLDYAGHALVLSGDTRVSQNLIRHAQGVDLLIHETVDADALRTNPGNRTRDQIENIIGHHTSLQEAGEVFSRVKPKLAVYSHVLGKADDVVAGTRKTYSGPLEVGEDLMTIEIGDRVEVHRAAH
jgi:ribonuclease Z